MKDVICNLKLLMPISNNNVCEVERVVSEYLAAGVSL